MAQIIIEVKGNFNVDKISTQTQKKTQKKPQKEPQKEAQTQTQTKKMGLAKKIFQPLRNKINATVTGEGPTTPPATNQKTHKKNTWLFIALAVGGVLLLTSGKKKKKN